MCIHWVKRYSCGHYEDPIFNSDPINQQSQGQDIPAYYEDLKASTLSHCWSVDQALRFWHDQPLYEPLEAINNTTCVSAPKRCPPVFGAAHPNIFEPTADRLAREHAILAPFHSFTSVLNWQHSIDRTSQRTFRNIDAQWHQHQTAAGNVACHPTHPGQLITRKPPYPVAYIHWLNAFQTWQNRPFPEPNVIIRHLPYGCARRDQPACMHGYAPHTARCPWLLAHRIRSHTVAGVITPEGRFLADITVRGGARLGRIDPGQCPTGVQITRAAMFYRDGGDDDGDDDKKDMVGWVSFGGTRLYRKLEEIRPDEGPVLRPEELGMIPWGEMRKGKLGGTVGT